MKINEIVINPAQEDDPSHYLVYFKNSNIKTITIPTGKLLKIVKNAQQVHMGIFDKDDIISYTSLNHAVVPKYWQIDYQCTLPQFRGQGYMRYMIEYSIKNWGPIASDIGMSPLAKETWTAIITRPNGIDFYYFNIDTGNTIPISVINGVMTPNPWDNYQDTVILAKSKTISECSKNRIIMREKLDQEYNRPHRWVGNHFVEYNP